MPRSESLPVSRGIQTFRKLREQDCYYVDKTAYGERLLREGTHYFLSRPRRFGKSLFLDTLKEFFEGNEESCSRGCTSTTGTIGRSGTRWCG